jgi:hypothetical protein
LRKKHTMKTKAYVMATAGLFSVAGLIHLLRIVEGWSVSLGSTTVPVWLSVFAVIVSATLALLGFSLLRKA